MALTRAALRRINAGLGLSIALSWLVSFSYFVRLNRGGPDGGFARRHLGLPGAPPPPVRPPAGVREESRGVHVVLSTDCSPYQNWQSIASFYGLRRAGHEGPVTRVVSGCPNQDRKDEIVYDFRYMAEADGGRLGVHFTPPFTMKNKYKYANKPGGVYHWMNATGQDVLAEDDVLALVDPDMLALRPVLPSDLTSGRPEEVDVDGYRSLSVYRDAKGREVLLRETRLPDPRPISRGSGAGQHFGLGALWADAGTDRARPGFADFDVAAVCGADSPCARATPEQVKNRHSVGPVYVATAGDWRSLLPRWHGYTPRVHAQYPKLLAEMTAFVMAAADVELDFSLSSSYMVSDARTSSPTEAWYWIDKDAGAGGTTLASVCDGATYNSLPHETLRRLSVYGGGRYPPPPSRDGGTSGGGTSGLPNFLHYCQKYTFANHTFAKRKFDTNFFNCDGGSPLEFDGGAIVAELRRLGEDRTISGSERRARVREAFMICHAIPMLNMALEDYKADVCS